MRGELSDASLREFDRMNGTGTGILTGDWSRTVEWPTLAAGGRASTLRDRGDLIGTEHSQMD